MSINNKPSRPAVIIKGKPVAVTRGDPVSHDPAHNCLSCMRNSVCKDPARSFSYRCSKWRELPSLETSSVFNVPEKTAKVRKTGIDAHALIAGLRKKTESDLDLEEMVAKALDSDYATPPDLRIDDSDIPLPPNFYTWVSDPTFASMDETLPFAVQMKLAIEFLGEYCPRCSDIAYLAKPRVDDNLDKFLGKVQLLERGVCPRCHARKHELVAKEEIDEYYEMAAVFGQRSGKNMISTLIESYNQARLLKIPSPQALFRLPKHMVLTSTYVSLTFDQARQNYWDPLKNIIDSCSWYRAYHSMLDFFGEKYGEELYNNKDIFIRYKHKNIVMVPSGPNKRTLRGRTRWSAAIDEGGWFPIGDGAQEKERMSGIEIHTALYNSMVTVVPEHERLLKAGNDFIPKPILTNISSPTDINDLIMTRYRISQGSRTVYGLLKATWEVNPRLPRNSTFIQNKFAENPEIAMRDFGAKPPMSSMAWISELKNAIGVFTGKKNNVSVTQSRITTRSGVRMTTAEATVITRHNSGRLMTLDAGYAKNSFAFAIGHPFSDDGFTVEAVGEIIPQRGAPINFNSLYEDCILPLARDSGVQVLMTDRWQNQSILTRAEADLGLVPISYSLKYPDFEEMKEGIYDALFTVPKLECTPVEAITFSDDYPNVFMKRPVAHLLYQMLTVRDHTGVGVEKGSKATDDIFRAVALLYTGLNDPEIAGMLSENETKQQRIIGAIAGASSRGTTKSTNVGSVGSRGAGGGGKTTAGTGVVASSGKR